MKQLTLPTGDQVGVKVRYEGSNGERRAKVVHPDGKEYFRYSGNGEPTGATCTAADLLDEEGTMSGWRVDSTKARPEDREGVSDTLLSRIGNDVEIALRAGFPPEDPVSVQAEMESLWDKITVLDQSTVRLEKRIGQNDARKAEHEIKLRELEGSGG